MGNVMVVLDEEHERKLRALARQKFEGKKGSLSRVVWEAIDCLEQKDRTPLQELEGMFKNAKGFKYTMYKNRSELYD